MCAQRFLSNLKKDKVHFRDLQSNSIFLDFSGVFWWQLNCSNLFPESSLLRKNQCRCSIRWKYRKIFPSLRKNYFSTRRTCTCQFLVHKVSASTSGGKNFSLDLEKFCIQRLIFSHYLGKIAGLRPAIFSGTPRNSENQILSLINSKKWPESPQKHQKIQKSIMLK